MKREIDAFVFDLDGTVYLGDSALPTSVETIVNLRQDGKRTLFVSNKPLDPRTAYADKLTRLGIPTPPEDVITSAYVLGHHLTRHLPDLRYYVVGEEKLRVDLRSHGLHVLDEFADQNPPQDSKEVIDPSGIDAVIIAFDRTLDYRKLNTAYQALVNGARFFATNADKTCPMPGLVPGSGIPDAGATIAALEYLTGRQLELLAGKPSPIIMQVALNLLGVPAERCMMIGDRLETDILMGQQAGMATAAVLTGAATRADIAEMENPPDYVIENIGGLLNLII
jgi:arabinose operon protein AraL